MQTFYSNGKLLITGEYVVLDGAKALALPTKFGQYLKVSKGTDNLIEWESYDFDGFIWYKDVISFEDIVNKQVISEEKTIRNTLIEILYEAYKLNPQFVTKAEGYKIQTELTFPRLWGLGTSSTLINNLAQFINIDAFTLLKNSFGGSGYDLACAQNNFPLIYSLANDKPVVQKVIFSPDFKDSIYFVYLNQKQNSRTAIHNYFNKRGEVANKIPIFDALTQNVISANSETEFAEVLALHEIELSNILETNTVKEALFHDFDGVVKSLGAWGGDFVMVVSKVNPSDYFIKNGFNTIIRYQDMILE